MHAGWRPRSFAAPSVMLARLFERGVFNGVDVAVAIGAGLCAAVLAIASPAEGGRRGGDADHHFLAHLPCSPSLCQVGAGFRCFMTPLFLTDGLYDGGLSSLITFALLRTYAVYSIPFAEAQKSGKWQNVNEKSLLL